MVKFKKTKICAIIWFLSACSAVYSQSGGGENLIDKFKRDFADAMKKNILLEVAFKSQNVQDTKIMYPCVRLHDNYFRCIASAEKDNDSFRFIDVVVRKFPFKEFNFDYAIPETEPYYMRLDLNDIASVKPSMDRDMFVQYMKFIDSVNLNEDLFVNAIENDKPLKIEYTNGTSYVFLVDSLNKKIVQNFFLVKHKGRSVRNYNEFVFTVVPDAPRMVTDDRKQKDAVTEIRFNRSAFASPNKTPGVITNKYIWMGKHYLDLRDAVEIVDYIDRNQELSLHTLKLLDSNLKYHSFFLSDVYDIKNIRYVDNEGLIQPARDIIIHNREITEALMRAWDTEERTVYVEFRNRPMFKGVLTEYVPSYSLSKIVHAVAQGNGGRFAFVRNTDDVDTIYFVQKHDDEVKQMMENRYLESQKNFIPPQAQSFSVKNSKPVSVKSTLDSKIQYELRFNSIDKLTVSQLAGYQVEPPAGDYDIIKINVDLRIIKGKPEQRRVYFDEFMIFDTNEKFFQYYSLLVNNQITDSADVGKKVKVFSLIVFAPAGAKEFFVKFNNLEAVKVSAPE